MSHLMQYAQKTPAGGGTPIPGTPGRRVSRGRRDYKVILILLRGTATAFFLWLQRGRV